MKPHWPWDAPNSFYHMYDPAKIDFPRLVRGDLDDDWAPRQVYNNWSWNKITEQMHRVYRARYYGSLSWLDSNIGDAAEDARPIEAGATGPWWCIRPTTATWRPKKGIWLKSNMFEASARVPLLIRMPGVVAAGKQSSELINHVDYFPTLAGLVGAEAGLPKNLTGKNLAPMVLGARQGAGLQLQRARRKALGNDRRSR